MKIFSWEYAFYLLAVGLIVGALCPLLPWWAVILGGGVLLLLGWLLNKPGMSLFITAFLVVGWLLASRIASLPPPLEPQSTTLTGKITQMPILADGYQQTIIQCAKDGYYQQVVLYLPETVKINTGDYLLVTGKLSTLKGARNPGDPDRRHLKGYQHLYYQLKTDNNSVEVLQYARYKWRDNWHHAFEQQAGDWMPDRIAAILTSVVWGDAAALNDDDYRLFQEIGLLHVFAASGMNVGCLLLAAALIASIFSRRRALEVGTGLALTAVYSSLIGWPVSILRAALMALFASLAYLGGRKAPLKEALFLAALLLLVIDPGWLFTPGFQLTITATWGLMVLAPVLKKWWFSDNQTLVNRFLLPILAAELAVWPLTVYYFNLVAPVSLLANLVLAPLISILVILGILALFAVPIPILAMFFLVPCRYLLELIMMATTWLHSLPGGHWWVSSPSLLFIVLYYLLLWSITKLVNYPRHQSWAGIIVVTAILIFSWPRVPSGKLVITFIDVGQGDSIHISTAGGRQVLIDGGGSVTYPVGRLVVLPYLHRQGINRLDLIINTHPHDDHLLGLKEVMQAAPCSRMVMPKALKSNPVLGKALNQLPLQGTAVSFLQQGDTLELDSQTRLKVLSPEARGTSDVNNSSLVLQLSYQEMKILLMGDAEAPVAEQLLASRQLEQMEIIKIGHHGSARSQAPDFYQALQPKIAVISVGRNNGFGHPSPGLVEQLQKQGITVLRTDLVGGIRMVAKPKQMEVRTYASP